VVSFFPLILVEIFGTEKHIGRLLAIGHLAYSGGLGTMPIVAAYAFDRAGSFIAGFIVNSVMTWLAVFALTRIGTMTMFPLLRGGDLTVRDTTNSVSSTLIDRNPV
jgi:hypothetical protein